MELMLNLVWMATALAMLAVWLRLPRSEHTPRVHQALCLVIAIMLLLPAISLSDDLVAAQAAREADCCLRSAQDGHVHHPHLCTSSCAEANPEAWDFQLPQSSELLPISADLSLHRAGVRRIPFSRPPPSLA